jgi:hypothetical protein
MKILIKGIFKHKNHPRNLKEFRKIALTEEDKDNLMRDIVECLNKYRYYGDISRVK